MKYASTCWAAVAAVGLSLGVARGAGPAEGWRVDFDDGTLGGAVKPRYVNRSEGRAEPGRASWKIEGGIATVTSKFDPDSARGAGDYVPLEWRELDLSLTEFPVLEMRFRVSAKGGAILVQGTYEYVDGSRQTPYFYAAFDRPGEWTTLATRLVGDSSRPTKWTPRRMRKLTVWLMGDRPVTADFDWIRLRTLDDADQVKEEKWKELLKDYEPRESKTTRTFFPFGVYCTGPISSALHSMARRCYVRIVSMNHLNYIQDQPGLAAAEEMGVRASVRVRNGGYHFEHGNYQKMYDYVKAAVDGVKDSPALVCYDIGDERPLSQLWAMAADAALLNKLDPDHDSVMTHWDKAVVRGLDAYVSVDLGDIYPLQDKGAASLYDWCRSVARDNGNKRQWLILQSFGCAAWRSRTGYLVPTPAQLRLQVWSALAGGARGIILYDLNYDRYKMMIDSWGNPNELMAEVRRLGEAIIPLGYRILDCRVDFETKVTCDNEKIIVGVVRSPERGATYVILANKDETAEQGGKLLGLDGGLFDLVSLAPAAGGEVEPLLPGGGRMYFVGAADGFGAEKAAILRDRGKEEHRSKTPDRLFKQRGCDPKVLDLLDEVGRLMGRFEPAMYKDNPDAKVAELMNPHFDEYWGLHTRWAKAYDDLLGGADVRSAGEMLAEAKKIAGDIRESLGDRPMYPGAK